MCMLLELLFDGYLKRCVHIIFSLRVPVFWDTGLFELSFLSFCSDFGLRASSTVFTNAAASILVVLGSVGSAVFCFVSGIVNPRR